MSVCSRFKNGHLKLILSCSLSLVTELALQRALDFLASMVKRTPRFASFAMFFVFPSTLPASSLDEAYLAGGEVVSAYLTEALESNDSCPPYGEKYQKAREELERVLSEYIYHPNDEKEGRDGVLVLAIMTDNLDLVKRFWEKGALPGALQWNATLFHGAARFSTTPILSFLGSKGLDVNTPEDGGATPLMIAAGDGRTEAVKWLLENGAIAYLDRDPLDPKGETALLHAMICKKPEIISLLIEYGAEISPRVRRAAEKRGVDITNFLIEQSSSNP